jgi:hypothetical protein
MSLLPPLDNHIPHATQVVLSPPPLPTEPFTPQKQVFPAFNFTKPTAMAALIPPSLPDNLINPYGSNHVFNTLQAINGVKPIPTAASFYRQPQQLHALTATIPPPANTDNVSASDISRLRSEMSDGFEKLSQTFKNALAEMREDNRRSNTRYHAPSHQETQRRHQPHDNQRAPRYLEQQPTRNRTVEHTSESRGGFTHRLQTVQQATMTTSQTPRRGRYVPPQRFQSRLQNDRHHPYKP